MNTLEHIFDSFEIKWHEISFLDLKLYCPLSSIWLELSYLDLKLYCPAICDMALASDLISHPLSCSVLIRKQYLSDRDTRATNSFKFEYCTGYSVDIWCGF
jgi:hypothetical protein